MLSCSINIVDGAWYSDLTELSSRAVNDRLEMWCSLCSQYLNRHNAPWQCDV